MSATDAATGPALLAARTRLGPVHLTVADLERSIGFYERAIGLRRAWREAERASLGTWERP